ncbi:MAG: hypothetical protein Q9O62_12190 [Ardenticatenia bacterium]|nr:hypothetical protein [Ardenticatenia bacterium]
MTVQREGTPGVLTQVTTTQTGAWEVEVPLREGTQTLRFEAIARGKRSPAVERTVTRKPSPPATPDIEGRLTRLEARLAALEARVQRLESG